MSTTLENLLVRIRDGSATAAELEQARELAGHDARLPEDLRGEVLRDEPEAEAAGLLALIGADDAFGDALRDAVMSEAWDVADAVMDAIDAPEEEIVDEPLELPLVDAIRAEAGAVDVASSVMASVLLPEALKAEAGRAEVAGAVAASLGEILIPVGDAVRAEAGRVDVSLAVMMALGADLAPTASAVRDAAGEIEVSRPVTTALGGVVLPVAEAILAEAGTVDVADAVLLELGEARSPLAEAILAGAGPIDVADAVMASLAPVEQAKPVLPRVDVAPEPLPRPANRRSQWSWGAVLMAAVVFLAVGIGRWWTPTGAPPVQPLQFASASEIVVEDLHYSEDVQVVQAEGDGGALILWIDEEEATL